MRALLFLPAFLLIAAAPQSVELPDADGPFEDIAAVSADAVNTNCLACHSSAMVIHQPGLSPAQWQATLGKMRSVYKAPIDAGDDAAILAWLNAHSARQKAE
jgi:hypothetical protein